MTRMRNTFLGLIVTASAGFMIAPAAQAYDGFCYQKESNTKTKGTVIGAVAGGALGNVVASDGRKTEGTILGAVIGAAIGNQVGEHQKETARANCLNDQYFVYDNGRYDPPPPPQGYRVAYFNDRPAYNSYYVHKNGKPQKWKKHRKYRNN